MTYVNFNRPANRTFNGFFNELFNENQAANAAGNYSAHPPVNITETESSYLLDLSVPGRNKEEFQVKVDKGLLTISYEKKEEAKTEGHKAVRSEFSFKSFKRSFTLDEKIDTDNIQAKYENGILKFVLPKKEKVKEATKQISIQ